MNSRGTKLVRWIADAAATALIGAVGNQLQLDVSVIAALAGATLIIALLITETRSRPLRIVGLLVALLVLTAGIVTQEAPAEPSLGNVDLNFVAERVSGQGVFGHITIQNRSSKALNITENMVTAPGYVAGDAILRRVEPTHSTELTVGAPNTLAQHGGDITIELKYHFEGQKAESVAQVGFTYPDYLPLNRPIPPGQFLMKAVGDFQVRNVARVVEVLDEHHNQFRLNFPAKAPDGTPFEQTFTGRLRRLTISVPQQKVSLDLLQHGAWRRLELPVKKTADDNHFTYGEWWDDSGVAVLLLDNQAVTGTTKTDRVAAMPAEKIYAHLRQ